MGGMLPVPGPAVSATIGPTPRTTGATSHAHPSARYGGHQDITQEEWGRRDIRPPLPCCKGDEPWGAAEPRPSRRRWPESSSTAPPRWISTPFSVRSVVGPPRRTRSPTSRTTTSTRTRVTWTTTRTRAVGDARTDELGPPAPLAENVGVISVTPAAARVPTAPVPSFFRGIVGDGFSAGRGD